MTLLGHGVHITPPQPIEEAIAWHTVPAQLSALRKMLRDAETSRQGVVALLQDRLKELEQSTDSGVEALQEQLNQGLGWLERTALAQTKILQAQLDRLDTAQQSLFFDINEHLDRLDEAQEVRLEKAMTAERKLTTQRFGNMQQQVTWGIADAQKSAAVLDDRIHQLEQAPLKRFWRWLTRPWRKNGSTL